jgi:hypothetical protein
MRTFIAALSGFCLTLIIFGGGALAAIFFINAAPAPAHQIGRDTGALWTNKAVRVNAATQDLERLAARPMPQQTGQEREAQPSRDPEPANNPGSVHATMTAATSKQPNSEPVMSADHVEWCSERYRSYDPADNSYNAYSGVRRQCVSRDSSRPEEPESVSASAEEPPELISAAHSNEMPEAAVDTEHIQSCFDRYQSYRPEDNTYQPYGGVPREQCE